jgi:hypothetical protein
MPLSIGMALGALHRDLAAASICTASCPCAHMPLPQGGRMPKWPKWQPRLFCVACEGFLVPSILVTYKSIVHPAKALNIYLTTINHY